MSTRKLLFSILERDGLLYINPQPSGHRCYRFRDLAARAGRRLWRLLLALK
ncbi:hypothetical protein [Burkholderia multivorans]|uniref:hypothetical protein n=1 Tax=Burkholderia multivorans TaxID=87883 RepID=UPI001C2341D6|nr:hypothetical protein [Burkholderia multivorans]MBU9211669.1 hypothetical protein [Burkholderia multivorans]